MTDYIFKSRTETAPGDYYLADDVLSALLSLAEVRKTVDRGDGGIGTLVGCVDSVGVNQGTTGILDTGSAYHAYGTLDNAGAWAVAGIIHTSGTAAASGILTSASSYAATGILVNATTYEWRGILDASGVYHVAGVADTNTNWWADGICDGSDRFNWGTYSAAGAYNGTGVIYGVGLYATEASRNSTTAAAGNIVSGHSVTLSGVTTAGTLDMNLWMLKTLIVSASWVVVGHKNYSLGGQDGTYPTTATSKGEQLAEDQAEVTWWNDGVLSNVTILGVTGTYIQPESAAYSTLGPGYGPGGSYSGLLAASKIRDVTYGTLSDADVTTTAGGSLDLSLYVIISTITWPTTDQVDGDVTYGIANERLGTGVNATTIRTALGLETANLDTQLATIVEDTGTTIPSVIAGGTKLAADGLDAIVATVPSGVATTFPQKLIQVWSRFFGRARKDATTIKTYASNGTTVATTQTYTSSASVDDVGAAT